MSDIVAIGGDFESLRELGIEGIFAQVVHSLEPTMLALRGFTVDMIESAGPAIAEYLSKRYDSLPQSSMPPFNKEYYVDNGFDYLRSVGFTGKTKR